MPIRVRASQPQQNPAGPVRRMHSCDQKISRAPNENRTGIFPGEADEPYYFVRLKKVTGKKFPGPL
jgi:hypothetical protein